MTRNEMTVTITHIIQKRFDPDATGHVYVELLKIADEIVTYLEESGCLLHTDHDKQLRGEFDE